MVEALFLVRKTLSSGQIGQSGDRAINGVHSVLINDDDGGTLAVHVAAAVAACNLAYPKDPDGSDPYPAGYFDTADEVSDLVAGLLQDDQDAVIFGANEYREVGTP